MAAKHGKQIPIAAAPGTTIDQSHQIAELAHQVGRYDMAVDLIRKAIALNDRIPTFHNNIGLALDALGRTQDAVGHYRRAIALKPTYVEAHNNLGATLQAQSKFDEALVHYRRALALRPDFAEAHNNLGNALKEQGRLDEAVARLQRALALRPNFAEAHNNLGNDSKGKANWRTRWPAISGRCTSNQTMPRHTTIWAMRSKIKTDWTRR